MRPPLTAGQRWWYDQLERQAHRRLQQLRAPREGRAALWNGVPPVPVEIVAEELLNLTFVYEEIAEDADEEILGCLRPAAGEIVLNTKYLDRFHRVPGSERHTIGHECGHADVFGEVAQAQLQRCLDGLAPATDAFNRSAPRDGLEVLALRLKPETQQRIRALPASVRTSFYVELEHRRRRHERLRVMKGADPRLIRRAVDYYAATLLMPRDLLVRACRGLDLTLRSSHDQLAQHFGVSRQSLLRQLEWFGLIHQVTEHGHVVLRDPADDDQHSLF